MISENTFAEYFRISQNLKSSKNYPANYDRLYFLSYSTQYHQSCTVRDEMESYYCSDDSFIIINHVAVNQCCFIVFVTHLFHKACSIKLGISVLEKMGISTKVRKY